MIRAAVNGFGRIGRTAFKIAVDKYPNDLQIVAINDLTDAKTLSHLLKYDSNYGIWGHEVSFDEKSINVDKKNFQVVSERDPQELPWKSLNIDVVIESTGRFTKAADAQKHIKAGAKRVVISAPVHEESDGVSTYILGVN